MADDDAKTRVDGVEPATRETKLPEAATDDKATRVVEDRTAVAELRARFEDGREEKLQLYALADQIVVGRGSAADWQLEDDSLSRKHCEFRWDGRELAVEDHGSANGTKVNGRAIRGRHPVRAGDTVQLGTVIIALTAKGASPDDQSTRLVVAPAAAKDDLTPSPGPLPEPPATVATPTVKKSGEKFPVISTLVKPPPGPAKPNAPVFRPTMHALGPDDPTQPWDPAAALMKATEPPIDWREIWRTHRRVIVLGGAAAWIAILLIIWSSFEKQPEDDAPPAPVAAREPAKNPDAPTVTQLDRSGNPTAPIAAPLDDNERSEVLAAAIGAYDQGHVVESLAAWRRLAADGKDPTAKFMVDLLEARAKEKP
jgi:predicted component of type VI protein secretion system